MLGERDFFSTCHVGISQTISNSKFGTPKKNILTIPSLHFKWDSFCWWVFPTVSDPVVPKTPWPHRCSVGSWPHPPAAERGKGGDFELWAGAFRSGGLYKVWSCWLFGGRCEVFHHAFYGFFGVSGCNKMVESWNLDLHRELRTVLVSNRPKFFLAMWPKWPWGVVKTSRLKTFSEFRASLVGRSDQVRVGRNMSHKLTLMVDFQYFWALDINDVSHNEYMDLEKSDMIFTLVSELIGESFFSSPGGGESSRVTSKFPTWWHLAPVQPGGEKPIGQPKRGRLRIPNQQSSPVFQAGRTRFHVFSQGS